MEEKRKLSEIIKERDELDNKMQEMLKENQKKEFPLSFGTLKVFNGVMKYLEKNSPWNAYSAAGLIMLYNNMSEQKKVVLEMKDNWDGTIKLRSANIVILWKMLTQMSGVGFNEAKDFVGVMSKIGEDCSNAIKIVDESNQAIRDLSTKIDELNNTIEVPGDDIEIDVDFKDIKNSSMDELRNDVAPEAE